MRQTTAFLVGLTMVVSLCGCGDGPQVRDDEGSVERKEDEQLQGNHTGILKQEPDFSLTAKEFFGDFDRDELLAAEKFNGKVVELDGVVQSIGRTARGSAIVTLDVERDALSEVLCLTVSDRPWPMVCPGQRVTVRGNFAGQTRATLNGCEFVELGESPAIEIEAEVLATKYVSDACLFFNKYLGKYLVIHGEVAEVGKGELGELAAKLKGNDSVAIDCQFIVYERDRHDVLKKGECVTLIGELRIGSQSDAIALVSSLIVKP